MQYPLVTLLTPCYNTGKYIHRLLNSVLNQTYPNIEMYVIDDGSTDDSKEVVSCYMEKFAHKGYLLNYLYQKNSGQSVAIQNGLKYVKGKYLAWPDSDDFYATNDAIEKMVSVLESSSDEFAMVRTLYQCFDEDSLKNRPAFDFAVNDIEKKTLFDDCIFGINKFYFCSGAYMVNFNNLINSAEWPMYTSKNAGQNWQLLLPILWNYRCRSISEKLYSILIRSSSHSRGLFSGYEKNIAKMDAYSDTILMTLDKIKNMPVDDCNNYKQKITDQYLIRRMFYAIQYGVAKDYRKFYKKLSKKNLKLTLVGIFVDLHLSKFCFKLIVVCRKMKYFFVNFFCKKLLL